MARAHIAVVCRAAGGTGGVMQVARRHCIELAREFDVTLVSDSFPPADELPGVRFERVTSPSFRALRRFAHVPNEMAFARAVRHALFRLEAVDFVIAHGDVAAVRAALPLRRERGVPFGFVTHGDMNERPPDAFDSRLSALYRWAEPRAAQSADLVIALGPTMADFARKRGAHEEAIEIVPNGIDLHDIGLSGAPPPSAARAGEGAVAPPRALQLLFAGRIAPEKGILDLLEAMRLLGDRAHLDVAGSGPLERSVRGPNVTLLGPVPRKQLGALYQAADLFVAPSISEAMPLVILEALAAGTPVLACPAGDIPSIVRTGENGVLVPPKNPAALADAIARLANDRASLRALASNARDSVLPRFAWESIGVLLRDAVRKRLR